MSWLQPEKRVDPLIDAYRQASALDAQTSGARPSAATRAAVLAHAHVVAQSVATATPKLAVSEAVRATPAANEPKPIWRMVAGVVLGLAGMWGYQLTRPGTTGEANVAVLSAPQSAKVGAGVGAAPIDATAAPESPAIVPATPLRPQPETTPAVAAPASTGAASASPAAPTAAAGQAMRTAPLRERENSSAGTSSVDSPVMATRGVARDTVADATRSEVSVAQAKAATPLRKAESPAQIAAPAPPAATSAMPEVATSEPLGEIAIASADTRKLARAAEARAPAAPVAAPAAVAAAPTVATAPPPNAFPATTAGAIAQSAPQAASPPPSFSAGGNAAMRSGVAGAGTTPNSALFSAVLVGNLTAFRAAIARGANVNARDEAGRTALQIARERNDAEMVKALDLAGAK